MTQHATLIGGVSPDRLQAFATREAHRYAKVRPLTEAALKTGAASWLDGVPMHWMKDWSMPFPMLVEKAGGAPARVETLIREARA